MSPPKKDIEVPTPQYHRMRLNLGTGSDRGDHGTVRSGRWPLTRSGWCPCKKGEFGHRQAHREDARRRWRCRLGRGVYEPRNTRGGRRAGEPPSQRATGRALGGCLEHRPPHGLWGRQPTHTGLADLRPHTSVLGGVWSCVTAAQKTNTVSGTEPQMPKT